jgi:hypothetical protein
MQRITCEIHFYFAAIALYELYMLWLEIYRYCNLRGKQ